MYTSYNGVFQNLFFMEQNNNLLFLGGIWFGILSKLDHDVDKISSRGKSIYITM